MEKLIKIQRALVAPKGRKNTFGNYQYRSCEDILEAVKPLLEENGCTLIISDDVKYVDGRFYIKATATIYDVKTKEEIGTTTAYARESEAKKGMDDSQITGTASSYARKYALNGLFLIDDTKDADTDEYAKTTKRGTTKAKEEDPYMAEADEKLSEFDIKNTRDILRKKGTTEAEMCKFLKIKNIKEMTKGHRGQLKAFLDSLPQGNLEI